MTGSVSSGPSEVPSLEWAVVLPTTPCSFGLKLPSHIRSLMQMQGCHENFSE
jgi:hypothetical protein